MVYLLRYKVVKFFLQDLSMGLLVAGPADFTAKQSYAAALPQLT